MSLEKTVIEHVVLLGGDAALRAVAQGHAAREMTRLTYCAQVDEALEVIRLQPTQGVMVAVPSGEAVTAMRRIRALPGCGAIPMALLEETRDPLFHHAAVEVGAAVYLHLPTEAEAFDDAVQALLAINLPAQPRVMILDEDGALQRLLPQFERIGWLARSLPPAPHFLPALEEFSPDVILLNRWNEGLNAVEICRLLRTMVRWRELPIGILGPSTGRSYRMDAIQARADDYLERPFEDDEVLSLAKMRWERVRNLREKYDHDLLTGLPSRRPFIEALRMRLTETERHGRPLALALLDLDHFKSVNDLHGHLAGDSAMKRFGRLLMHRFRAEDLRGRWGGEEFVLAFPGETPSSIVSALERLLDEYREIQFTNDRGEAFSVTWSAGVAGFPQDGTTLDALLRVADRRLYRAKARGRKRIEVTE